MDPVDNSESDKLRARLVFARNLRATRVAQGFATARSLAKALGIDENRYTRYERAEVEPDLTLLTQICVVLHATPDALLGFVAMPTEPEGAMAQGALSRLISGFADPAAPMPVAMAEISQLQAAAWNLANVVAAWRLPCETVRRAASLADPMAALRETVALQRELLSRPYEAIGRIADDPVLAALAPEAARELSNHVQRLTELLGRATG